MTIPTEKLLPEMPMKEWLDMMVKYMRDLE